MKTRSRQGVEPGLLAEGSGSVHDGAAGARSGATPYIALAWSVLNRHFQIALLLLKRGANINTNWATHEPASILHEAAIQGNEDAVRFLIDRGANLTITDYRYHSTAEGWARDAAHNERIADLLAAAAARRSGEGNPA